MKKLLCSVALVGLLAVPSFVSAQTVAGPYVAYHEHADFGIGGFVSVPLPEVHENLSVGGSFGLFFPGTGVSPTGVDANVDFWQLNLDGTYTIPIEAGVTPFILGGLNITHTSLSVSAGGLSFSQSKNAVGLNLGGGIYFDGSESIRPFAGAKIEAGGGEGFVLFAGLGFQVGG